MMSQRTKTSRGNGNGTLKNGPLCAPISTIRAVRWWVQNHSRSISSRDTAGCETVYTSPQEASMVKWATLLDAAIRSVADTIAATGPERLILWAGIGVLFAAATVSNGSHREPERAKVPLPTP